MFIVLKKKTLITAAFILVGIILVGSVAFCISSVPATAFNKKTVVLDAGHGGADKGVIGKNGTVEAEKNLEIAFLLKEMLEDAGFNVVMTRKTADGAGETANFKQEDFANRKRIIEKASPDLLLSIHCNKFPSSSRRGIQVFYNPIGEGKVFSDVLQESLNGLNAKHVGKMYSALSGEYFMLNCTDAPSAIVECGFLSNPDDEALLNDNAYLDDLVFAIYAGIINYFD